MREIKKEVEKPKPKLESGLDDLVILRTTAFFQKINPAVDYGTSSVLYNAPKKKLLNLGSSNYGMYNSVPAEEELGIADVTLGMAQGQSDE